MFYKKCLGRKITLMMTWEGSPLAGQAPPSTEPLASALFREMRPNTGNLESLREVLLSEGLASKAKTE